MKPNQNKYLNIEFRKANFCAFLVNLDCTRAYTIKDKNERLLQYKTFSSAVAEIVKTITDSIELNYYLDLFDLVLIADTYINLNLSNKPILSDMKDFIRALEIEGDNLLYTSEFKKYATLVYGVYA